MPPSPTPNEVFIELCESHLELMSQDPVPKGLAVDSLFDLENAGMSLIANDSKTLSLVSQAMVKAFGLTLEANVQPPLSDEQSAAYIGKITTFKALIETAPVAPKEKRFRRRIKPTDTNAVPTDKSKS